LHIAPPTLLPEAPEAWSYLAPSKCRAGRAAPRRVRGQTAPTAPLTSARPICVERGDEQRGDAIGRATIPTSLQQSSGSPAFGAPLGASAAWKCSGSASAAGTSMPSRWPTAVHGSRVPSSSSSSSVGCSRKPPRREPFAGSRKSDLHARC
ncbi:unnamed protein product, partial [Prorocentrum cordatum]